MTGNGTWDLVGTHPVAADFGDSVIKLLPNPSAYNFSVMDWYTPPDVLTYPPPNGGGLCINDEDLGSGGILIFPQPFSYNGLNLMVSADKQSNLYFENLAGLGNFNANGGNNVETYPTPNSANNPIYQQPAQGYWASPAYWEYPNNGNPQYLLYYSATVQLNSPQQFAEAPYPIYQYALATTAGTPPGPISNSVNLAAIPTPDLFCFHSPTPSVSSYGTAAGSGILWAVERRYSQNPTSCQGADNGSALHAYVATGINNELYNSSLSLNKKLFDAGPSVPTVFQSRVYVGTAGQVYVFGLCETGPNSACVQPQ